MACRFSWCETPADIHADDISYHTRELGHGMKLTVELDGRPSTNWMPDWDEWWIDRAEDIGDEYKSVVTMLRELTANYNAFRDALLNDPVFADEVAAMRAKDAKERCK